jgi:GcrA cell cycle regulator
MDWTSEAIEKLRAYWGEGLSTAEIGRRMGISKNAVVGKAHRLNLTTRPSPIRQPTMPRTTPPRSQVPGKNTAVRPRRPPVNARKRSQAHHLPPEPIELRAARLKREEEMPSLLREVVGQPTHVLAKNPKFCCWLSGDEPPYTTCNLPVARGSYCQEHASLAFTSKASRSRALVDSGDDPAMVS